MFNNQRVTGPAAVIFFGDHVRTVWDHGFGPDVTRKTPFRLAMSVFDFAVLTRKCWWKIIAKFGDDGFPVLFLYPKTIALPRKIENKTLLKSWESTFLFFWGLLYRLYPQTISCHELTFDGQRGQSSWDCDIFFVFSFCAWDDCKQLTHIFAMVKTVTINHLKYDISIQSSQLWLF